MYNIDKHSITFIGGPLDLQRQEFHGRVPPYWRCATAPKLGPVFEKPNKPHLIEQSVSFDYQIVPMHDGQGREIYIGFPMRVSP